MVSWGYIETGREADRLKQLSEWLFVAPCVLCFGDIINCIIRTPCHSQVVCSSYRKKKTATSQTYTGNTKARGSESLGDSF